MKWYFAGRVRHKEKLKEIFKYLEIKGETVLSDWVYEGSYKPYDENLDKVQTLARRVVVSLLETDIFVLISDPEGTDMFVELGVCLAQDKISPGSIRIYIIGEHSKRSLMQLHPSIKHLKDVRELFEEEKIEVEDFVLPDFN
ncbi:MAG: hypothetical protein WCV68_04280 [Candidatus Paceibacterota bacterium]|jgi:hypothetical protein